MAHEQATRQGATRIHLLRLRIGPLSGVVPDSLRFAFDVVSCGTLAEGGRLEIEEVPVVCFCPTCAREFTAEGWFFECPSCGQSTAEVRQGAELELVSLEVS
jgi:hydrogenase nickel incorporation protein HypA/HybF